MATEKIVIFHEDERGIARTWSEVGEIVRCKDCKYLSKDEIAPEFYRICRRYGVGKPDNGFCDEGERSEDELRKDN